MDNRGAQGYSTIISPYNFSEAVTLEGPAVSSNERIPSVTVGSPAKSDNELKYTFNAREAQKEELETVIPGVQEQGPADQIRPKPESPSGRVSVTGVTSGGAPRNTYNLFDPADASLIKTDAQTPSYTFKPLDTPLVGTNKPGTQEDGGMLYGAYNSKADQVEPLEPIDRTVHEEKITPGQNENGLPDRGMLPDASVVKGTEGDPRVELNITRSTDVDPAINPYTKNIVGPVEDSMLTDAAQFKDSPDYDALIKSVDVEGNEKVFSAFAKDPDEHSPLDVDLGVDMTAYAGATKGTQDTPRIPVDVLTVNEDPNRDFTKDAPEYPFDPSAFVTPSPTLLPGEGVPLEVFPKGTLTKDSGDNQVIITYLNDRSYDDRKKAAGYVRTYRAEAGMGFEKKLPLDLHLTNIPGFRTTAEAASSLGVNPRNINNIPEEVRIAYGGPFTIGQNLPYYDMYFSLNRLSRPIGPRGAMTDWAKTGIKKLFKPGDSQGQETEPGKVPKTSEANLDKVKPRVLTIGGKSLRGYGYLEVFSKGNIKDSEGNPMNIAEEAGDQDHIYKGRKRYTPWGSGAVGYGGQEPLNIPARLPFQFTPQIAGDSKSASWAPLHILGRSNNLYTYTGSENRTLSLNLTYAVLEPAPVSDSAKRIDLVSSTIADLARSAIDKDIMSSGAKTLERYLANDYQGMEDLQGWDENTVYWILNTIKGLVVPQYHREDTTAPVVVRLIYGNYFKKRVSLRDKNGEYVQKTDIDPLFIITQVAVTFEGQINQETKRYQIVKIALNMIEVDEDIFTFEGMADLSGYLPYEQQLKNPSMKQSVLDKIGGVGGLF